MTVEDDAMRILGIDIGGSGIKGALVGLGGMVITITIGTGLGRA